MIVVLPLSVRDSRAILADDLPAREILDRCREARTHRVRKHRIGTRAGDDDLAGVDQSIVVTLKIGSVAGTPRRRQRAAVVDGAAAAEDRRRPRVAAGCRYRAGINQRVVELSGIGLAPRGGHAIRIGTCGRDRAIVGKRIAAAIGGHAVIEGAGCGDCRACGIGERIAVGVAQHRSTAVGSAAGTTAQRERPVIGDGAVLVDTENGEGNGEAVGSAD